LKQGKDEHEITYASISRELAFRRTMFNVLIKAGKATKNPVFLITFFEEIQKERILSSGEISKILGAIEKADSRYRHLKEMTIKALNTAMRQGEILSMEKNELTFTNGIINAPREAMKRKKKNKRVPINPTIRTIMQRLLKENPDSEYYLICQSEYKKWLECHFEEDRAKRGARC
jgi:integrase